MRKSKIEVKSVTLSTISTIPYWDGKTKSFGVYLRKIKAYDKFIGIGDALDHILMENCPT